MLMWELLGTVLGAGVASGREVASFFSRYGAWSIPGIILACCTLMLLANCKLPQSWKSKWSEKLWRILLSALLIVTGGAMLSGAGEVAALLLPLKAAYTIGIVGTLALAWFLAHRTQSGLAWTSRAMLIVLASLIVYGIFLPRDQAAVLPPHALPDSVIHAVAYGGFNAALLVPVLENSRRTSNRQKKTAILSVGLIFMLLLLAGNAVLLRHPILINEPLPFICLMQRIGKNGYYLAAASLYLAILSTLTACFRGMGHRWYAAAAITAVAMLGFSGVVEVAYPVVGFACLCLLVAAKFTNCFRKPFQAGRDML